MLDRDPVAAMRCGRPVEALASGGSAAMQRDVAAAQVALRELEALDTDTDTDSDWLEAEFLRDHLRQEVAEAQRFWYRFPVTPYNAYPLGAYRTEILSNVEDSDRFLALLNDYAAVVERIRETLTEQRRRGIRLPGWAVGQAVETMRGHFEASAAPPAGLPSHLADGATRIVEGRLAEAFRGVMADLASYAQEGGDGVGIGQYPGGAECYAGLIGLHTGLELSAEQVHSFGLAEVGRITEQIRGELGIRDEASYRRAHRRTSVNSPEAVQSLFQSFLDRLRPHLPAYFNRLPRAPFRLRPLDASLGGLTYGFYEPPGSDGCGYYHYNTANLPERPLLEAASVIYHEALPGHHLQFGLQLENAALHPLRREATELRTFSTNGFVEGWAEYAASLCDEIGLYSDPVDRYGRLCSERFQAARLVVDTGLNVLGWTRERAARYLALYGALTPGEIDAELLRFAVDDPGQALAYHIGHRFLHDLRGNRDPRAFHEAVLSHGPLPLHVVQRLLNDFR